MSIEPAMRSVQTMDHAILRMGLAHVTSAGLVSSARRKCAQIVFMKAATMVLKNVRAKLAGKALRAM